MAEFNLDGLLEDSIDDIADLPEFKPWASGTHSAIINFSQKEVGDNKDAAIEVTLTLVETLDLDDPSETPPVVGDKQNILCKLQGEEKQVVFGKGKLKAILVPLGDALGIRGSQEIMEQADGMTVTVATGVRLDKKNLDPKGNPKAYFELIGLIVG